MIRIRPTANPGPAKAEAAVILIAVVSLCCATYLAAQPRSSPSSANERHHAFGEAAHAQPLAIRIRPRALIVDHGGIAKFRIRILHNSPAAGARLRRSVRLRIVRGLPPGATATFKPNRTRRRASTLVVATGSAADGTHRMRIRARSHGRSATARARVTISNAQSANFDIGAEPTRPMAPGISVPLDLTLTNPQSSEIAISDLGVRVSAVTAPGSSATRPCTGEDFAVVPFSGAYGFRVAAGDTTTLSELGFPVEQHPQLKMIDRPVNQDGCKGASLALAYDGTSTMGTP